MLVHHVCWRACSLAHAKYHSQLPTLQQQRAERHAHAFPFDHYSHQGVDKWCSYKLDRFSKLNCHSSHYRSHSTGLNDSFSSSNSFILLWKGILKSLVLLHQNSPQVSTWAVHWFAAQELEITKPKKIPNSMLGSKGNVFLLQSQALPCCGEGWHVQLQLTKYHQATGNSDQRKRVKTEHN